MPQQRDPFMWKVHDVMRAAANQDLITEPWPQRDHVLYCDEVSVSNATHSGGDVIIGLLQGGHFFELDSIFNLVAGHWHYGFGHFTFHSKWQIAARFLYENQGNGEGCVAGDIIKLHVVGFVLEPYSTP